MMKGSTHHGLIMASALNNKLRDTWSPNWQRARQDSGQLPRSHMKPGHQPCPAWGHFSGRFSLFLSVPWSLHPGSLQAGRCIPASPYPLEPGGVASPSLAPALGMREGAASRTSAPAIRAAPEPTGPCALRVSERCPLSGSWTPPSPPAFAQIHFLRETSPHSLSPSPAVFLPCPLPL